MYKLHVIVKLQVLLYLLELFFAKLHIPEVVLTGYLTGKKLSGVKSVPQQRAGSAACDTPAVCEAVLQGSLYRYFSHPNYRYLL